MRPGSRFVSMSAAAGLTGGLIAWSIVRDARGDGWLLLELWAALAAAAMFPLCWTIYFRRRPAGPGIGALAGAVASTLAHPVAWYLMICANWIAISAGWQERGFDEPLNPLNGLGGAAVFTFWSVLIAGWITLPAGAALGALFGWYERKRAAAAVPVEA